MTKRDILVLSAPMSLNRKENPPTGRWRRLATAFLTTKIEFLRDSGLIRADSNVKNMSFEETEIFASDLTPEGEDFFMALHLYNWLGACDRKSNDLLRRGVSDEERLAVYQDPKGLYRRLEKFRKDRREKAH